MEKQGSKQPSGDPLVVSLKWLWHFFSSVRLALALILIIAGLSLLDAFTTLGVIGSIYFTIPSIMLMVNIFICSLNRWKTLKVTLRGGLIIQPDTFFETGVTLKDIALSFSETAAAVENVLVSRGYRIRKASGNGIYIAADKNRYFRLGTYLTHFSLILFVAAFLWGSHFGFQDTNFMVTEGETAEVGHNTGLSLKLVSFVYEQYDNGMPKDYRSQVILYENGQPVQEALVRVNHPLNYKGTRFYQSFFGTSAVSLQIQNELEVMIFDGSIPVSPIPENPQYFQGYQELPDHGFDVVVMASSIPDDQMIPAGYIGIGIIKDNQQIGPELIERGTPTTMNGLDFTFREILDYSGFQVSQDPSNAFIWIASGLFILGLCAVFYFPLRQVWLSSQEDGKGSRLSIQMHTRPSFSTGAGLKDLEKELRAKLLSFKGKE
jgi:cytochrome c biogenesis protein